MPKQTARLNRVFHGLADPTRRAVLERLSRGPAPVTELARPFRMKLPSFVQHLDVLERCGLVKSHKTGRVRTYRAAPQQLRPAWDWLDGQRQTWEARLGQLDSYLASLQQDTRS